MKEVAISEFKAKCLSLIDEVQKTKKPICITRFGKPVAEVSPPSAKAQGADWFGSMKDEIQILGDIISPANDEDEWEVLRDETAPGYAHLDMEHAGLGSSGKKNRAGNQKSRE
jgi:prevent-host-death family protein